MNCPPVSTRSCTAMARRSHGRTPKNAYDGGDVVSSVTVKSPSAPRSADHSRTRCGCRNVFHDCGPALFANAAPSSRARSR